MVLFASTNAAGHRVAQQRLTAIRAICGSHLKVARGESRPSSGLMVGTGVRAGNETNFAATGTTLYQLKSSERTPANQRIQISTSSNLAKDILMDARLYHSAAVVNMETIVSGQFLNTFPMFVTKNYQAALHQDDD